MSQIGGSLGSTGRPRPVVLLVLDGFGIAPHGDGNAITHARTPNLALWTQRYPVVTLKASGEEVGLSWGEMGNSEVGHLAIGAGRVYSQTLPRINKVMADGGFLHNEAFAQAFAQIKKTGGTLHLIGIISSGKVHGFDEHGIALVKAAKAAGVKRIAVHGILDGRDTLYNAGREFVSSFEAKMKEIGVGFFASLSGRFYAMDRDNRWDRVEKAYKAIALGESPLMCESADEAIAQSYAKETYDEEFVPTVLVKKGKPVAPVVSGDAIIFFNFRSDRARELTKAFVLPAFDAFAREYIQHVPFVTMTEYEKGLPVFVAFPPVVIAKPLAEVLSDAGLVQLHIAETEKYAHVTFFLNGTREEPFPHEDRVLVPSPHVATYDQKPEMSAYAIADRIVQEVGRGNYDVILGNFANADMVGHTGNLQSTIRAVEVIDECLGKIVHAVLAEGGAVLITADHGNAEEVLNLQTHDMDKEHSTNPVPFWIIAQEFEGKAGISGDVPEGDLSLLPPVGMLADVAPTLLALVGVTQPPDMTGTSLLP
jgi:2,3-bisphosphoglycerate-independent phosphoglycerate mutase